MTDYPATPPGWAVVERRGIGRFTTSVTFENPDGRRLEWSSRRHRKHASRLSRVAARERVLWAPHRASWWIAVLFILGSACFAVGPLPAYLSWVGASTDAATFFVGSVFFTSAGALQWLETINTDRAPVGSGPAPVRVVAWEPRRIDWWSSGVQLLGTLYFNATTYHALSTAIGNPAYNKVVWRPDAFGSVCFLVSGLLAYVEVTGGPFRRPHASVEGAVVSVNLLGCVAFAVSAVASFVPPSDSAVVNATVANTTTVVGALCFLVGAALLLPEGAQSTA